MDRPTSRFSLEDFMRFKESSLKNLPESLSQTQRNEIAYRIGKTIGGKMGDRFLNDAPPVEEFQKRMRRIFEFRRFSLSIAHIAREGDKGNRSGEESTLFHADAGLLSGFLQYYLGKEKMVREIRHREANEENYRFEIVVP